MCPEIETIQLTDVVAVTAVVQNTVLLLARNNSNIDAPSNKLMTGGNKLWSPLPEMSSVLDLLTEGGLCFITMGNCSCFHDHYYVLE